MEKEEEEVEEEEVDYRILRVMFHEGDAPASTRDLVIQP